MKVLVLGGGIIGVTTAWMLAKDGHEVTLVDRRHEVAEETSYANAGLVAPGHAYVWSSPRAPRILLKSLVARDQALRFKPNLDPRLYSWSLAFLRQCTPERARLNTVRKHRLCVYSQRILHQILDETGVDYDGRKGGLLYLYRSQASFDRGVANMGLLQEDGQAMEVVDRNRAAVLDPALAKVKDRLAGGIYCPTDESGDARLFTRALAVRCAARGVVFRMGVTIKAIAGSLDVVERIVTDHGDFRADAYVLALGPYSPILARTLGVKLSVYPIKGYSLTLPIAGRDGAPHLGGVDEDNLVAYARMGDRLRVTATAEFAGYDTTHRPSDFAAMLGAIRELYPEGADYGRPGYWAGLRPMTPEGTPIFGRGPQSNLYYNTGQGHMGWTMSSGSARITADLMAGRRPEIDIAGMTLR